MTVNRIKPGAGETVVRRALQRVNAAMDAGEIPGTLGDVGDVTFTGLADDQILRRDAASAKWVNEDFDHGNMDGLADDDHTQYYNSARHTKALHDGLAINADQVDGFEATQLAISAYKTASESVLDSTTLQNDNHLFFAMVANGIYSFRFFCLVTQTNTNPDIQFAVNAAAACTAVHLTARGQESAAGSANMAAGGSVTAYATPIFFPIGVTLFYAPFVIEGTVENGGTATTLYLQWAQRVKDAANAIFVRRGSYLEARKIG